ncbi:MAG: S-layer homology domain-containing protein [Candidatus Peregrinibacteria bacterium]|nr:S-layer homology domain-containing protein [Candidatus Peregrinibacteria bacterium]MDZ4244645.1 S-layer homology domain-containing protein [Candidatus Gracilibacteria bacterium]
MDWNIIKNIFISVIYIILYVNSAQYVFAASVTWDGDDGDLTWSTCTNWSSDACPTTGDDVTIDANAAVLLTAAPGVTLGSITLGNSGGTTTPSLVFKYNALGGTALTTSGNVTVYDGANITHQPAGTTAETTYTVSMVVGGDMTVSATGTVNVSNNGCQGRDAGVTTSGFGPNGSNVCTLNTAGYTAGKKGSGGAGHGGAGGSGGHSVVNDVGAGGTTYDTALNPVMYGSSSGTYGYAAGAHGGGVVRLSVTGTLTINGTISANGGVGDIAYGDNATGGGAGGSINITTGTIAGTGSIVAVGGAGANNLTGDGGGGGGGMIYLGYYNTDVDNLPGTLSASGNATGGAKGGGADQTYGPQADGSNGSVNTIQLLSFNSATTSVSSGTSVDRLTIVFNQNVTVSDPNGVADGLDSITLSQCSVASDFDGSAVTGTDTLVLSVDCSVDAPNDTSITIDPTYATGGTTSIVDDATSTEMANATTVTGDDGAAPVFVSAVTTSTTNIQITMSESIDSVTFGEAGAWTATGITSSNVAINGGDASILDLTVGTLGLGFTAADLAFTAGMTASAILDAAGNSVSSFLSKAVADGLDPDAPGSFAKSSGSGTTADMTWTATSDTNFNHYEIWYGTSQTDVQNMNGTAVEWDDTSDDENLAIRTTTTTTITGLTAGLTYYALICAVDNASNSGCSSDISFVTNQTPTVSTPGSISQATDGTGYVTFSTTVADADGDETKLKVEYSEDGGSSFYDADLVSATPDGAGSVDLDDAQTYQIGTVNGIDTDAADTVVTIVWDSKSASNGNGAVTDEQSDIQVRVTANDSIIDSSVGTSTSFSLDNGGPAGLASFTSSATTSSSITWTWTAATSEGSAFDHYVIWSGENQSDVENRTGTASEWDDSDDTNLTTISTATTTIAGLSENTTYYAKIWAVDSYGNESTLSTATANNNGKPTLSGLSATQADDGSGDVTIQFTIDDADDDDILQALVEYNIGDGWVKLNLSEDADDITQSAATPDIDVENDNTYQVGNATGYILSSIGANTITVLWPTLDDGGEDFDTSSAQVRVTPFDGIEAGSALTASSIVLDNTAPTGFGDIGLTRNNANYLVASWSQATDSNFDRYVLCYGQNSTDVSTCSGTASYWTISNDSALTTISTITTTITDVSITGPGVFYYAKLIAVDLYDNEGVSAIGTYTSGVSGASTAGSSGSTKSGSSSTVSKDDKSGEVIAIEIKVDTDKDGLTDDEEAIYGTDPLNSDTDNDGYTDRYELINLKSDPKNICSPGNSDLDPKIVKSCESQYLDPNSKFKRIKRRQLFVGKPKDLQVIPPSWTSPVPNSDKQIEIKVETKLDRQIAIKLKEEKFVSREDRGVIAQEEPVKKVDEDAVRSKLDKLNQSIRFVLRPMRNYANTAQGNLLKSIETVAVQDAPWSERHFKLLLQNKVISDNVDNSKELASFIENIVSEPNRPLSQLDSLKLVVVTSLLADDDPTLESVVENFNKESLKVAEARQLFISSEDLNFNTELTRGEALSLLFRIADVKQRAEFITKTLEGITSGSTPFKDVKVDDKYAPYVTYFYEKGYINGYSDGTFKPNAPISNAEFVKLLNIIRQASDKKDKANGVSLKTSILGADKIKLDSIGLDDESSIVSAISRVLKRKFIRFPR